MQQQHLESIRERTDSILNNCEQKKELKENNPLHEMIDDIRNINFDNCMIFIQKHKKTIGVNSYEEDAVKILFEDAIISSNLFVSKAFLMQAFLETNLSDSTETNEKLKDVLNLLCKDEMNSYDINRDLFRQNFILNEEKVMSFRELNKKKDLEKLRARAINAIKFMGELYNRNIFKLDFIIEKLLFLLDPESISNVSMECFCILMSSVVAKIMFDDEDGDIFIKNLFIRIQNILHKNCYIYTARVKYLIQNVICMVNEQFHFNMTYKESNLITFPLKASYYKTNKKIN